MGDLAAMLVGGLMYKEEFAENGGDGGMARKK